MGAGDGHASLRAARTDPAVLAIAIDPSLDRLRDGSRTAQRQKLANALFVVASIESLPWELQGRADEVTVNFPWGSLLTGLVQGDRHVLEPLARLAKPGAPLYVLLSVEANDRATGMAPLSLEMLSSRSLAYARAGLEIEACRLASRVDVSASGSSWAKRLGDHRRVYALELRRNSIASADSYGGVSQRGIARASSSRAHASERRRSVS